MTKVLKPGAQDKVSVRHISQTAEDRARSRREFREQKEHERAQKEQRFAEIKEKSKGRKPSSGGSSRKGINIEVTSD